MNLLLDYKNKILKLLTSLEKNKILSLPKNFIYITIELPPKDVEADISCNAAMLLSKINNTSALKLAEILKESILKNFKEIEKIDISKKGFLNISFKYEFWNIYLLEIVKKKSSYG